MDANVLALAIKAKVVVKNPEFVEAIGNNFDWLFESVAEAVVEHIQSSAVVTVAVASVSGVTPGVGVSGSGAGTGTIS